MLVVVLIDLVVTPDDASINNVVFDDIMVESDIGEVWIRVVVSDDFTVDVDVEMGSVAGSGGSNADVGEVFGVVDVGRIGGGQITVAYF